MNSHLQQLLSPAPLAALAILGAACATLAVSLARARRRIEELILVDALTGLGNRRLMERELPRELARARRSQRWLFVAVADVDGMESYNRAFGRPAGHALLAGIGSILRTSLRRAGDHAFRDSGDDFVFAFSSDRREDGLAMAERIRFRVVELGVAHPANEPVGKVTVSIGLAAVSPATEEPLATVEARAREGLTAAREEGRNRSVGLAPDGARLKPEP